MRRALVSLALLLVAGACREATKLDVDALQRDLPAAVVADHADLVTDVVCPPKILRGAGTVVECSAAISGTPVVLTVVQIDDDGAVRVELDRTLLDVGKLAADVAARLTKDVGVPTTVVCDGPAVRVLAVGDTYACTATDASNRSRRFRATILDQAGAFELQIV